MIKKEYPCEQCDEACYYHCTKGGQQDPECVIKQSKTMTKKEIIIKSRMDLKINAPYGICDNTGFATTYCENGISDILDDINISLDDLDTNSDGFGIINWRPKSLKGIENNNGWIKIESEDDLPKDIINCFVFTQIGIFVNTPVIYNPIRNVFSDGINFLFWKKFSHYHPIQKPEPPIY